MGGWLMLLTALALPNRISGLVGIAAAPDFTRGFYDGLSANDKALLNRDGRIYRPSEYDPEPYVFTKALLDDGNSRTVLDKKMTFKGRIRLLHGMLDEAVPWELSLKILAQIETNEARVQLIKDGDHRLSRESDLRQICQAVADLSEPNPDL